MGSAGEKILIDQALREQVAASPIFCRDPVIAWSHRRRFQTGLALARTCRGPRLLDYGCGDGTFLAMLSATADCPVEIVGAELHQYQVTACRTRFGARAGLSFVAIDSLDSASQRERYDTIVCMEVLEHVVEVDLVIERLWRLLAAEGTLLLSVPVEIGLPLLVKQAARSIAGWRGIGDYPGTSSYNWHEYYAGVFAGSTAHLARPIFDGAPPLHDHKGFNWKALRERLSRRFVIDRVVASPLRWLGPGLATQVWFVARKSQAAGDLLL